MMKKNLLICLRWQLTVLFILPTLAFAQVKLEWINRYNDVTNYSSDDARAIAVDAAGNVVAAGSIENRTGDFDYLIVKRGNDGNRLWTKRYNGTGNGDDRAIAVATDNEGNIYVTGKSYGGTESDYDYATIKYDKAGARKWTARYDGPGKFLDEPRGIAVDRSGNVYVTGNSIGTNGANSYFSTIKYNSAGVQQWVARYKSSDNSEDRFTALAVDEAGNVYITGNSSGFNTKRGHVTIKYNTDGVQQWMVKYHNSSDDYSDAYALALDASGNVYVAGKSTRGACLTVKYDKNGVLQWDVRYVDPAGSSFPTALALDSTGNVYVTGYRFSMLSGYDYITVKYNKAGIQQWSAGYNGGGNDDDIARSLAIDDSGNVYVTGSSQGSGTGNDFATIKYSPGGKQQWVARINGPGNGRDEAFALALDASGNAYVAGQSWSGASGRDLLLVKYGGDGTRKWAKRKSGSAGQAGEETAAMAVNASGRVCVTGWTNSAPGEADEANNDFLTIMYRADGSAQWVKTYDGPGKGCDRARAIAMDALGNVYVTGQSEGNGSGRDYTTIKYDMNGAQQWVSRYNGSGSGFDFPVAIAVDASGNVYVTGSSKDSAGSASYATVKYNPAGQQQWVAEYFSAGIGYPVAVAVDVSGNVYVTGSGRPGDKDTEHFATIKYNAAGKQQWVASYYGPGEHGFFNMQSPRSMAVDGSGNVYVTGVSRGWATDDDYATIKYNAAGEQQWVTRYNGFAEEFDFPNALALDASGNVYVTGMSHNGTNSDYATVKYNTAGEQQWVASYNSGGIDVATALAVDASGNVFVTGHSETSGFYYNSAYNFDYVTVKYTATGGQQWLHRFNGTGNWTDRPTAIGVDALENVYVAGTSTGLGTGNDLVAVKYSQPGAVIAGKGNRAGNIEPAAADNRRISLSHFPSPVATSTRIQYELPADGQLSIRLYDALGRVVSTLVNADAKAGTYSADLDASRLQKGIYYYKITLKTVKEVLTQTNKMTVVR